MQEHIRLLLERAQRTEDRFTISGKQDSVTIIAEDVIRLAHLATSSHILLAAQEAASNSNGMPATIPPDNYVQHLKKTEQEQTS